MCYLSPYSSGEGPVDKIYLQPLHLCVATLFFSPEINVAVLFIILSEKMNLPASV